MTQKPNIFKAILSAILGLIVFGLVYLIAFLVFGLLITFLADLPLIGPLLSWLFSFRGDSPDMVLAILCPMLSYFATLATLESITKEQATFGLSGKILGICLMVLHIVSLIINLLTGEAILMNITQGIAGYLIFATGRDELRSAREPQ